jgi:K+-transporting ATPase A subunit
MAKQKKKRNKVYSGVDAAITRPIVTRISAANRTKIGQYWFDHKRILKPVIITSAIVIAVIILIVELVHIIAGA